MFFKAARRIVYFCLAAILLSGCGSELATVTPPPTPTLPATATTRPDPTSTSPNTPTSTAIPQPTATPTPVPTLPDGVVFSILANNHLVAVRLKDGTILAELKLGPESQNNVRFTGRHYLGLSVDKKLVFTLVPGGAASSNQLAIIDAVSFQLKAIYSLVGTYTALAVGPTSGRVYLFGNRGSNSVVTVLDPATGKELANWVTTSPAPEEIYQGAVSSDERYLYTGYHNNRLDWFEVDNTGLLPCPPSTISHPGTGCLYTHGGFALYGDTLITTDGEGKFMQQDRAGKGLQEFFSGLGGHQMEFVVDTPGQKFYTVKSCLYLGGVSAVDLAAKLPLTADVLVKPNMNLLRQNGICGDRQAVGPDPVLVAARIALTDPVLRLDLSNALLFIDRHTGQLLRTLNVAAAPLDVIVAY